MEVETGDHSSIGAKESLSPCSADIAGMLNQEFGAVTIHLSS